MKRDDVLRMAREAGFTPEDHRAISGMLIRFAALVAAAEREKCAQACEVHAARVINDGKQPAWAIDHECAAAIRARKDE